MVTNCNWSQLTVLTGALDIFMRLLGCMIIMKTILAPAQSNAKKVILTVLMKLDKMKKDAQGECKIVFLVAAIF